MPNTKDSPGDANAGSDWSTYRRLLGYARPYLARLLLGVVFGLVFGSSVYGLLTAIQGALVHLFGDAGTPFTARMAAWAEDLVEPERVELATTLAILAAFVFLGLVRGVGDFLSKYLVEWVGHRVVMDLRNATYEHIQDLSLSQIGKGRTGEFISRTGNDTQMVAQGVSTVLGDLVRQPFTLVAALVFLLLQDLRLAAASLVIFPICIVPVALFGRRVRRSARRGQARLGDLASQQQETVTGSRIVKAFGMEDTENQRFRKLSLSVFRQQMKVTRARAALQPIIELISIVTACVVLLYAQRTGIDWIELFAFLGALIVLYEPVKKLSRIHLGIQRTSAAADRIFEILDTPLAITEKPDAKPFEGEIREIIFDKVSFRYEEDWVLRDIDLTVKAGECIAFVGSSGSGKTTLVSLLPRFFDVNEGAVRINRSDLRDLTLKSLRGLIGIVTQDTILFNDTVAANIGYGTPGATLEAIEHAARRAHAHDFIQALDGGYDAMIGERGALLSGGQRQRLAIARALLRNPPILILDEATSALDTESERQVQAALDELMEGRTVFAIAHRLSTIRHADRILVLEQGRIAEQGSHRELLERGGAYKYFHDLQLT